MKAFRLREKEKNKRMRIKQEKEETMSKRRPTYQLKGVEAFYDEMFPSPTSFNQNTKREGRE
jgi:hypothetical protein